MQSLPENEISDVSGGDGSTKSPSSNEKPCVIERIEGAGFLKTE